VFDRNISMGVDLYRRDLNSFNYRNNDRNTTFQQTTTGGQVRLGVPLTEYLSLIGSYTLNFDNVGLDENQFFSDRQNPPLFECDPLLAGRYLCEALGKRTSSILGVNIAYDSLDSRLRPTRGRSISLGTEFAGLGGSVKYVRVRGKAQQFWPVGGGFIFSLSAEGGAIKGLGGDGVRLTDRFFLGEPQIRGFDIRGVGPRVLRQPLVDDPDSTDPTKFVAITDRNRVSDDSLGGKYYYLGRAELEIPLGSGAKELGLRPSIFMDVGALWGVRDPVLQNCPFNPSGTNPCEFPQRDANGNLLYSQVVVNPDGTTTTTVVTTPTAPNGTANAPLQPNVIPPFQEVFLGDSPKPRLSIGIGVNWNSPFGPFRIDFAHALLKEPGDDTKRFTFNVGTQF
jgi:outer membrane protein insertion porin family